MPVTCTMKSSRKKKERKIGQEKNFQEPSKKKSQITNRIGDEKERERERGVREMRKGQ